MSIDITFQKYDDDWGEYVDLNEDEFVKNKEKLKVVVSSVLHTPTDATVIVEVTSMVLQLCCVISDCGFFCCIVVCDNALWAG